MPTLIDDGFELIPGVYDTPSCQEMFRQIEESLRGEDAARAAIRNEDGDIYAARNLHEFWAGLATLWRRSALPAMVRARLGEDSGLVRALYFDKIPGNSWALPWHKDLTICVQDNTLPTTVFRAPTRKAGRPHVEAPVSVLEGMLTARIHLDPVNDDNGPLRVIAGSHRSGKELRLDHAEIVVIHAQIGDVLLMRPLLTHSSNRSKESVHSHRRILHLEFASSPELPEGYRWNHYERL
jgi:hypothetical protein